MGFKDISYFNNLKIGLRTKSYKALHAKMLDSISIEPKNFSICLLRCLRDTYDSFEKISILFNSRDLHQIDKKHRNPRGIDLIMYNKMARAWCALPCFVPSC
ncbi:hypothetical protein TU54_26305 [Bacillus cereus]|nr:hypothetical protein TU54_26305 [Bacillus cereus]